VTHHGARSGLPPSVIEPPSVFRQPRYRLHGRVQRNHNGAESNQTVKLIWKCIAFRALANWYRSLAMVQATRVAMTAFPEADYRDLSRVAISRAACLLRLGYALLVQSSVIYQYRKLPRSEPVWKHRHPYHLCPSSRPSTRWDGKHYAVREELPLPGARQISATRVLRQVDCSRPTSGWCVTRREPPE
jgi:hypothetical protein